MAAATKAAAPATTPVNSTRPAAPVAMGAGVVLAVVVGLAAGPVAVRVATAGAVADAVAAAATDSTNWVTPAGPAAQAVTRAGTNSDPSRALMMKKRTLEWLRFGNIYSWILREASGDEDGQASRGKGVGLHPFLSAGTVETLK